jgi:protein TonB
MHLEEPFKERYPHVSKDGFRDTVFAISASLAFHAGIALILTTATVMSAGLKLWENPVLHVSLVSLPAVVESQRLPDTRKTKYLHREMENAISEIPAAVVSIDKQEKNKIKIEKAFSGVVEIRSVTVPVSATAGPDGSESKEKAKKAQNDAGRQADAVSNTSSSVPISMAIPRYRDNTHPVYPWVARMRGYEGVVLLSAEIHADGQVGDLKVKKTSGFAVLDRSALEAVKTWKFEPGKRIGTPISMWVDVPVKFILKDSNSAM